jgi:cellulose biosynthesis protein BcsQ
VKAIAFFNNKGGVGKTTLAYHVAWMLAERGFVVLAADLDRNCSPPDSLDGRYGERVAPAYRM